MSGTRIYLFLVGKISRILLIIFHKKNPVPTQCKFGKPQARKLNLSAKPSVTEYDKF